jgi:hypothetical protein
VKGGDEDEVPCFDPFHRLRRLRRLRRFHLGGPFQKKVPPILTSRRGSPIRLAAPATWRDLVATVVAPPTSARPREDRNGGASFRQVAPAHHRAHT